MNTLHAWISSPIRRSTRRALVAVTAVVLFSWIVLVVTGTPVPDEVFLPLVLLWTLVVMRLGLATHRLTERHSANLDEREIELRNRIFFRSYQMVMVVGLVLMLLVLTVWTLDLRVGPLVDPGRAVVFALVLYVMLVLNLPWALLAWHFPDPVAEEDGRVAT